LLQTKKDLKAVVLDQIAKTYHSHKVKGGGGGWNCFKTFVEMEEYYSTTNPFYTSRIKKNVEIALAAKQAEVLETIKKTAEGKTGYYDNDYADSASSAIEEFVEDLKKRLKELD
jgi:hypothetical protein